MPQFIYRTTKEKGRLEASDKESALRILRNMSIDVREIGEEGKEPEPIDPPPGEAPAPDQEAEEMELGKKLLPLLKVEEGEAHGNEEPGGLKGFRQDMIDSRSRTEATAKIPLEVPQTMKDKTFLGIAHWKEAHPDVEPVPSEMGTVSVYRKETFLHGSYNEIRNRINELLGEKFGQVKHVDVQPDMKGNIVISMVIEHDVPVEGSQ